MRYSRINTRYFTRRKTGMCTDQHAPHTVLTNQGVGITRWLPAGDENSMKIASVRSGDSTEKKFLAGNCFASGWTPEFCPRKDYPNALPESTRLNAEHTSATGDRVVPGVIRFV